MAEGVRLRHAWAANMSICVEHPTKKLKRTVPCARCQVNHTQKAIHMDFDDNGTTIVSQEVLELLKQCGLPDLEIENPVSKPPAQKVFFGGEPPKIFPPPKFKIMENRLITPKIIPRSPSG